MALALARRGYDPTEGEGTRPASLARRAPMAPNVPKVPKVPNDPVPSLAPADAAAVDRSFADGVERHGRFAVTAEGFRSAVASRAARHVRAQGLEATPERVAAYVGHAALEDVYLAVACEAGDERAWASLSSGVRTRLEGCAVRRGASPEQAQSVVQDLLGDLARPSPQGGGTLLSTFDGTGSLFGWLAIALVRRLAAAARGRHVASLEGLPPSVRDGAAPPSSPPSLSVDPPQAAFGRDVEDRFRRALAAAWRRLSAQERLVLAWKHRDGLTQRRIADLLGVVESRVSRVVADAVAALAAAVKRVLSTDDAASSGADLWARLAGAVALQLRSEAAAPPPSAETPPRPASSGGPRGARPVSESPDR